MRLPLLTTILANTALSNNPLLPELPVWQARSFYAQILLVVSVLLNFLGIDLFRTLGEIGWGSSPEEVLATGDRAVAAWQQVAPLIFGLWAWIERRAPNFRLVWWGTKGPTGTAALFCLALILGTMASEPAPLEGLSGPNAPVRSIA